MPAAKAKKKRVAKLPTLCRIPPFQERLAVDALPKKHKATVSLCAVCRFLFAVS